MLSVMNMLNEQGSFKAMPAISSHSSNSNRSDMDLKSSNGRFSDSSLEYPDNK